MVHEYFGANAEVRKVIEQCAERREKRRIIEMTVESIEKIFGTGGLLDVNETLFYSIVAVELKGERGMRRKS